jgi:hypothetical protein
MVDSASQFTEGLINQLEQRAKAFYEKTSGGFYEAKTVYNDAQRETFDNVRSHDIDIYYNNHIIRFSYYPHVPLTMAYSVLTCYVSLEKVEPKKLFYPLSQVYGYFKLTPANSLCIPLILSDESMKDSFDLLSRALIEVNTQIKALSYDIDRQIDFFNSEAEAAIALFKREIPTDDDMQKFLEYAKQVWYPLWKAEQEDEAETKADFERFLSRTMDDINMLIESDKKKLLQFYYHQLTMRVLGTGYEAYMVGNYALAIKKLKKLKLKTPYDNSIIDFIKEQKVSRPHVPDSVFINLTELYKNGISKNNFKEALAVAPAMLLFGLIWLPVFLGIYFLFYFIENTGAVYLLGPLSNAPSVMLPAMLMGIPMIYFKSKVFYKLFFKRNYQKLITLENAVYSRSTHRYIKFLTSVLFAGSFIFLLLTVHQNIKLIQNGFYDNTDFWSMYGSYYRYEEVNQLQYRKESPDGHGGTFPYPSYVIQLKNGKEVDLSDLDSCNEQFLQAFRSKGVFVEDPVNEA